MPEKGSRGPAIVDTKKKGEGKKKELGFPHFPKGEVKKGTCAGRFPSAEARGGKKDRDRSRLFLGGEKGENTGGGVLSPARNAARGKRKGKGKGQSPHPYTRTQRKESGNYRRKGAEPVVKHQPS